ncbi:hypothetical protein, partial [Ectopseudomonas oleovorans]|uniref:hypothetical protein n=1 Tax=Ectopseudomonas oleovorans TaxID=301 RepID=UPI00241D7992
NQKAFGNLRHIIEPAALLSELRVYPLAAHRHRQGSIGRRAFPRTKKKPVSRLAFAIWWVV